MTYTHPKTAATIVIAASNSLHPERADFKCNGTDDQITVQAAIDAAASEGAGLYFLDGDQNWTGGITVDHPISLIGANRNVTINLVGGFDAVTLTSHYALLRDLYFEGLNQTSGNIIVANGTHENQVIGCRIYRPAGKAIYFYGDGWGHKIIGNSLTHSGGDTIHLNNINSSVLQDNFIESATTYGIRIDGTKAANKIIHNWFEANTNDVFLGSAGNPIIDNFFYQAISHSVKLDTASYRNIITDNYWQNPGDWCVDDDGGWSIISGNRFEQASAKHVNPAPTTTVTEDNIGLLIVDVHKVIKVQNKVGSSVVVGDVVCWYSNACGYWIDTNAVKGFGKVAGMIAYAAADNAWTWITTEGKVTQLKVDGTQDILIGDFLCMAATHKIACKAGSGDMAFARALEGYTTDDANGVIDAVLFSPRQY